MAVDKHRSRAAFAALDENETTELISKLKNQVGNWSSELSYTYDSRGNIETISENGTQKAKYYYDDLSQLVREDNLWLGKTIAYTYDNGGNIQLVEEYAYTSGSLDGLTATNSYTYLYGDSNWKDKLTSYNGNAITYDAIGNPTDYYNGYHFTWQNGRELSGISGNGLNASYKYNADGIRTSKTVDGKTTTYTLEGTDVVYETNGMDSIWYNYDASGALVSMTYNGTTYYYVTNLQGDVVALTDSNRNVVVNYVYDSWGKLVSTTGSEKDTIGVINPYRYRGYRYDTETGLYYLQSRYYNPEMKRFINADVYVDTGDTTLSTNMFAYCENSPVISIDPSGAAKFTIMGIKFYACKNILASSNYVYNKKRDITLGFVNGQGLGKVSKMKFGLLRMKDNGCGVIATYNLLKLLRKKASMASLAYIYELYSGAALLGALGLKSSAVSWFLNKAGISYTKKTSLSGVNSYCTPGSYAIIYFKINKNDIFEGMHYVAVKFLKNKVYIYNAHNSSKAPLPYSTLSNYIGTGKIIVAFCVR